MHADAFLEAIVSEPDELAHRLVYADWLEDNGGEVEQARAEFIRLQCHREELHPADPRARAMLAREHRLLGLYEADWAGEVRQRVARWGFRRGFIEEVALTADQVDLHAEAIFRGHPIQVLQLRQLGSFSSLDSPGRLLARLFDRIRVLDLNRQYLTDAIGMVLLNLPTLPRLEGLLLAGSSLSAEGLRVLADSPVLDLLHTLEINVPANSAPGLRDLLASPRLANLRRLSLAASRAGAWLPALLAASPVARRLRDLDLSHGLLAPEGLHALLASGAVAGVERLGLGFNPLGPAGVRLLADAALPNLRDLNLSRTSPGREGAGVLARSPLLGQLTSLDLSLNQIGMDSGELLAGYPHPTRLLLLDLIYNELSGRVMAALRRRFGEDVCLFTR